MIELNCHLEWVLHVFWCLATFSLKTVEVTFPDTTVFVDKLKLLTNTYRRENIYH